MPQLTIETDSGLDDFIQKFLVEVVTNGKRFKTCNFEESDKDSIVDLLDYNFYTIHKDLSSLTSSDQFKVTFEVDDYVLPSNVIFPVSVIGEWLFGFDGLQGGTLGTYLMALQHYVVSELDVSVGDLILPNKSRIDLFNTKFT